LSNELGDYTAACEQKQHEMNPSLLRRSVENLILMISPITPFIAEELWRLIGHEKPILEQRWPQPDTEALERDEKIIVIQVNGKLRDQIIVPAAISENNGELERLAVARIKERLEGKPVKKVIVVPGKLVNVVI
ncbi:MAG TPA: class I tRNA ligase family protein, partial [bacterium]